MLVLGCCIRNQGLVDQTGLVCQLPRATATERKLQQQVSATNQLGLPVRGLQAGKPGHLEIGTRSAPICEHTGPTPRSQHTKPTHGARLRNQCTPHPKCSPGHAPLFDLLYSSVSYLFHTTFHTLRCRFGSNHLVLIRLIPAALARAHMCACVSSDFVHGRFIPVSYPAVTN